MGITVSMRGGDMNKKVYDPDGDGIFDTDEIAIAGAKGVTPLSYYISNKRIFQSAGSSVKGAGVVDSVNFVDWGSVVLDVIGKYTIFNFRVPPDYFDTPKILVVYGRTAGEPILDLFVSWAADGELRNANTESIPNLTCNRCDANNKIGIMDIGAVLAGLDVNDMLGVKILMDTNIVYILGCIFDYNTI